MFGWLGGRAIVLVLNRLGLAQGLHADLCRDGGAGDLCAERSRACVRISRGLSGRAGRRQSADPRAFHHHRLSRRGDLARADRHVHAARAAGVAGAARAACAAGARHCGGADAGGAAGGDVALSVRRFDFRSAKNFSSRGSDCAARSAFFWRRSRCWCRCPMRKSISTSDLSSCWCRCWCRAGASRLRRIACMWRCRRAIPIRIASNSICPDSSRRNWSAIRLARPIPICAAG